jgi:hypothetical protein
LFEIGEHELEIQRLGVPQRIDAARGVPHRGIIENAQDMRERIDLTQRSEDRRISCAIPDDAPNVHVLHCGICDFSGLVERG